MITNENTGYEFLNEKQLRLFFQLSDKNADAIRDDKKQVKGYKKCESISFMKPFNQLKNRRVRLIDLDLPDVFGLISLR